MDVVVKLSTDYNNIVAQFTNPRDLRYIEELRSYNDCTFTIPLTHPQSAQIIKFRKVQIYTLETNVETLVWTGYVSNFSMDFFDIFVICSDEKRYIGTKKCIFADKSWSAASISSILSTLTSEANSRAEQVADLQSRYRMNDDAANTTVDDSYGSQDGTAQQNTANMSRDGKLDKALLFDGATDYVTLSSSSNFGIVDHSFTVSAWVNLASLSGDKTVLGQTGSTPNQTLHLCVRNGAPHIGFYGDDTTSDTILDIGEWYHIAFVFDKDLGIQKLYINGELDKQTDGHSAMTGTGTLYIGQWVADSGHRMHGLIDELRIYDSAKSDDDVMELYSSFGIKHGQLTYETNLSDTFTRDFDKGTSYDSILNAIVETLKCEMQVTENKIILNDTIGEDKTSGANFTEVVSNIHSPNENTITKFLAKDNGEEIYTSVIGKDGSGYSNGTQNTDLYGYLETSQYFDDGDLANQVTKWLEENSESHLTFDNELMPNVDFRDINIGDLIVLRIERNHEVLDVEASFKVIYKDVVFENGVPKYSIKLSENAIEIFNAQNYISRIAKRLKRQELK